MYIYLCRLVAHEGVFFASKEVSQMYITMPYVGNYALTYALGLANVQYLGREKPSYKQDISCRDIYVYPAKFIVCNWTLSSFNATGEGYYLKMGRNVVIDSAMLHRATKSQIRAYNSPQIGQFKLIGPESEAIFFVKSTGPIDFPKFVRLGKFMSKCELIWQKLDYDKKAGEFFCKHPINPVDLSKDRYTLKGFNVVSIKPVPLIENVRAEGEYTEFDVQLEGSTEIFQIPIEVAYFSGMEAETS
jgi:CRISPR-associated protein Csc1